MPAASTGSDTTHRSTWCTFGLSSSRDRVASCRPDEPDDPDEPDERFVGRTLLEGEGPSQLGRTGVIHAFQRRQQAFAEQELEDTPRAERRLGRRRSFQIRTWLTL